MGKPMNITKAILDTKPMDEYESGVYDGVASMFGLVVKLLNSLEFLRAHCGELAESDMKSINDVIYQASEVVDGCK